MAPRARPAGVKPASNSTASSSSNTGLFPSASISSGRGPAQLNPTADGKPDEEGEYLLEFGRQARAIVHQANKGTNLGASFSGEHMSDARVPVLDYTWEWKNGFDIEELAPFRYVFPEVRLNANVNEHPRGALLGFIEGALINVMPGNMRSHRLSDCPELVTMLRKLTALRRRFLPYFTEGRYRYQEGLTATGCTARLYTVATPSWSSSPIPRTRLPMPASRSAWKPYRPLRPASL